MDRLERLRTVEDAHYWLSRILNNHNPWKYRVSAWFTSDSRAGKYLRDTEKGNKSHEYSWSEVLDLLDKAIGELDDSR